MKTLSLIFLFVIVSQKSFAAREVILPPIQFINEVGGVMNGPSGKVACFNTNSQSISSDITNNVLDGVCGAWRKGFLIEVFSILFFV